MPHFAFPSLLGPGYLVLYLAVALPIVIHLINMLRHRRVRWAAMEFLLVSRRKNQTRVRLEQLLLLLMRMAALALVALLVAQPLLNDRLASLFGSSSTHHVVLLDDSFSMSDRWADTSALDEARRAIERLGKAASERAEAQTFSLVRFSRVGRAPPDMQHEVVDREAFVAKLNETLGAMRVAPVAASPLPALTEVAQGLHESSSERCVVYLVSDFRRRDWDEAREIQRQLRELGNEHVELHLVNCVDRSRPNLAITSLVPAEGIQAAQVPFNVEVTVRNFGKDMVRDVQVLVEEDGHARPAVTLARIAGGESVTQSFPANFPAAGEHQIIAHLESDAVALDNYRYTVLQLPDEVPVLLVDGDPAARDARYVRIATAPGGSVLTGIRPQIETPRDLTMKSLDSFQAINLMNIDHLDPSAIEAIERYVRSGGGVAIFLGDRTQASFVNENLYRDGRGFFPLPVRGPAELPVDRLELAPDVDPTDHFIFRRGLSDAYTSMLRVRRYFAAPDDWKPEPGSTVEVLARLRNGMPLVVAKSFGKGRVVAILTSAGPTDGSGQSWNNWARTPSFVASMLDLEAYLSHRSATETDRHVGAPLTLTFDTAAYQRSVRFTSPSDDAGGTVDATPTHNGTLAATLANTYAPGVYEVSLARASDGVVEPRWFAYNVDAAEGDLEVISKTDLAARLEGVGYVYEQADMFQYTAGEAAGYNLSQAILIALVVLLLFEQFVARRVSYHPTALARGGAR